MARGDAADSASSDLADRPSARTSTRPPDDVASGDARTTRRTPGTDEHRTRRPPRTHRTSHRRQRRLCGSPQVSRRGDHCPTTAAGLDRRQLAPRRRARTGQRIDLRPTRPRPLADRDTTRGPSRARRHGERRVSPAGARAALPCCARRGGRRQRPRQTGRSQGPATSTSSQAAPVRTRNGSRSTRRWRQRGSSSDTLAGSNASTTSLPRYGGTPHADAVERRRLTVGYDALTEQPEWVLEHLRRLHDEGRLGTTRVTELATRIAVAAEHLDRHGQLPDHWTGIDPRPTTRPVPVVEIDVPGL